MFSKLFTIAIAIIFWPVTLLIFGWAMLHTFLTTKVNYTPPTDPETGKALKSFYFGGEWEEIDLPSNEELITAWMFLLADCEVIDSEIEPQQKQELLERANHLLWQGYFKETEEEQTHSCLPQMLWCLSQNSDAQWLIDELNNTRSKLPPSYDDQLKASKLFRKHVSAYLENKDLLLMGGYTPGQDKDLDDAIAMWPKLIDFISQSSSEKANFESSRMALLKLYEQV